MPPVLSRKRRRVHEQVDDDDMEVFEEASEKPDASTASRVARTSLRLLAFLVFREGGQGGRYSSVAQVRATQFSCTVYGYTV